MNNIENVTDKKQTTTNIHNDLKSRYMTTDVVEFLNK